jgi:hypothetical protein
MPGSAAIADMDERSDQVLCSVLFVQHYEIVVDQFSSGK